MYVRTQSIFRTRSFVAVGWFCDACRMFQLDKNDIIEKSLEIRTTDKHRIYIRSTDPGRNFIPLANYYDGNQMFELDIAEKESRDLSLRVSMNAKTVEEAYQKLSDKFGPIPRSPFNKWAEEVVKMGRKEGYDDRKIASSIVEYGRKGGYSNSQISEVLRYNEVKRYISRHS